MLGNQAKQCKLLGAYPRFAISDHNSDSVHVRAKRASAILLIEGVGEHELDGGSSSGLAFQESDLRDGVLYRFLILVFVEQEFRAHFVAKLDEGDTGLACSDFEQIDEITDEWQNVGLEVWFGNTGASIDQEDEVGGLVVTMAVYKIPLFKKTD